MFDERLVATVSRAVRTLVGVIMGRSGPDKARLFCNGQEMSVIRPVLVGRLFGPTPVEIQSNKMFMYIDLGLMGMTHVEI